MKSLNRTSISVKNTDWFAYRCITPVILFFIVWNVIPVLWMVGLGFYKYVMTSAHGPVFVGLKNYVNILNDEKIWDTLSKTFTFVVIGVFVETCLGIFFGFLFWRSKNMPGRRLALTLFFAPMILTPIGSGLFFKLILDPSFGIINYILNILFNIQINFLGESFNAFVSILLVDIWMWTPFLTMMTVAALGSVPSAELEAAEIDRLSFYNKFRYIIWPHGKFVLILGILLRTIESFKSMDVVFTMTSGGPGNATELLGISLYRKAFQSFKMGESSALSIIALLVAIGFTAIFLKILNKRKKVNG